MTYSELPVLTSWIIAEDNVAKEVILGGGGWRGRGLLLGLLEKRIKWFGALLLSPGPRA